MTQVSKVPQEADARYTRRARWRSDFLRVTDSSRRVVDFHALRHTFITCLARGGVHPKVAQTLARHSTITLTMDRYSHMGLLDQAAALEALPSSGNGNETTALGATGTDGAPLTAGESGPAVVQRAGQRAGGPESLPVSAPVTGNDGAAPLPEGVKRHKRNENRRLVASGHCLSQLDAGGSAGAPPRTRTLDPLIKSQ